MRSILVIAIVSALTALLGGCGGDDAAAPPATEPDHTMTHDDTTTTATTSTTTPDAPKAVTIVVREGQVVGGIARPVVDKGDKVVLVVKTDAGEYVHLHGYDVQQSVVPGKPTRLAFTATIPGRFEVEMHNPSVVVAEVEVRP